MISKIREAIALFINNLSLFTKIILTVWLPGSILLVFLRYFVLPETAGGDNFTAIVQEIRISALIETAVSPLYGGAIIYALSRIKQSLPVGYGEAMNYGAKKGFKLFATRFSTGLIVFLGLLALIIPGIILSLRYYFIDEIVLLENTNGGAARKRSTTLTKGKKAEIFFATSITWILLFIFAAVIAELLLLLFGLVPLSISFVLDVLLECFNSVIFGLLYVISFVYYWDSKQVDYYSESSEAL